jgi:hypothetical protein
MMLKKLINPGCHKPTITEDGLYNPFMVILGMVYNWLYHINPDAFGESRYSHSRHSQQPGLGCFLHFLEDKSLSDSGI